MELLAELKRLKYYVIVLMDLLANFAKQVRKLLLRRTFFNSKNGDLIYDKNSKKYIPIITFSEKTITEPQFDGTGYISFIWPETKSIRHITSFGFEFKTTTHDGMILWIGEDLSSDDYLGKLLTQNTNSSFLFILPFLMNFQK